MLKKLFLWIILTIGISSLFYLNEKETNAQQVPDIVFETTNASAQPFDDHNFILNIDNLNKNKEICISRDCSFEIIKFHDSGHPAGGVSVPTPEIQSMYTGVDFRIYDSVYKNMSGLEREYQERWRIWANCDTKEIKKDEKEEGYFFPPLLRIDRFVLSLFCVLLQNSSIFFLFSL